jgi:hypothetical protein
VFDGACCVPSALAGTAGTIQESEWTALKAASHASFEAVWAQLAHIVGW